jgi:hypothetical protein
MPETNKIIQDADVYHKDNFIGTIYFEEDVEVLTVCTPEADYEFTLTKTTLK